MRELSLRAIRYKRAAHMANLLCPRFPDRARVRADSLQRLLYLGWALWGWEGSSQGLSWAGVTLRKLVEKWAHRMGTGQRSLL